VREVQYETCSIAEAVLVCSRRGGEMRLVAVIEGPAVIERILRDLDGESSPVNSSRLR
jgi:hypothetical protein